MTSVALALKTQEDENPGFPIQAPHSENPALLRVSELHENGNLDEAKSKSSLNFLHLSFPYFSPQSRTELQSKPIRIISSSNLLTDSSHLHLHSIAHIYAYDRILRHQLAARAFLNIPSIFWCATLTHQRHINLTFLVHLEIQV
jgi:hypothetical protein